MSREMSEDEREFVDDILATNSRLEVTEEGKVTEKPKKKRIPFYKNPAHWIGTFILLPVLVSALILMASFRADAYLGSESLSWLTTQELNDDFIKLVTDAGFGWLPGFIHIYAYRWFIIVGVFAVCFSIAGLIMYFDRKKHPEEEDSE